MHFCLLQTKRSVDVAWHWTYIYMALDIRFSALSPWTRRGVLCRIGSPPLLCRIGSPPPYRHRVHSALHELPSSAIWLIPLPNSSQLYLVLGQFYKRVAGGLFKHDTPELVEKRRVWYWGNFAISGTGAILQACRRRSFQARCPGARGETPRR